MSDRLTQTLANLAYEVISTTADQLAFYKRLAREHPNAVYVRPIQPIQQLNSLLNSENVDTDESRGAYSTKNNILFSDDTSQSDHSTHAKDDHFGENDHFAAATNFVELGDQKAGNAYGEGDSAIQQQFDNKSTVELAAIKTGDRVKYCGKVGTLERLCGTKQLEVIAISPDSATVKHSKWLVTQTVPLTDLRRV